MAEEAGMFVVPQTVGTVLCCKCGIPMAPNAANMCVKCLRSEVDITEGLQKHVIIMHCPECNSYLQPPRTWIRAQLESKELLTFCVKRLKNLNKHVSHRRTFFYLEQLILKHGAAASAIKIKQMEQGIDFFFSNRSHGVKFVEFIGKVAPMKSRNDKQLVSHDIKSNNYNYKYTFSVEICPICREDLICLPLKVAASLGNLGPLVICTKVTNSIALLDPLTLRISYLDADQYWRLPFKSLLTSRQLVEYIVLDVEKISSEVNVGGSKYVLADAQVARVSDFGKNDTIFNIRTHLGHLLNPGDYALGYDLYGANSNDIEIEKHKGLVIPEAILIRKSYEEKRQKKRGKPRAWKLKSLDMEVDDKNRTDQEKINSEYEQFLKDLEENPELRFNISLYRNKDYQPSEMTSVADGDDVPSIPLDELLADLDLSEAEAEDEDDEMRE
ncbi:60s ribosomal export protein nmd3 [Quercus suber]|uniref:60S ribosomal export protein NMD3 n=1 Tax=Quercus suber TaxID=58331 RepID=A0AAW0LI34_QUESU